MNEFTDFGSETKQTQDENLNYEDKNLDGWNLDDKGEGLDHVDGNLDDWDGNLDCKDENLDYKLDDENDYNDYALDEQAMSTLMLNGLDLSDLRAGNAKPAADAQKKKPKRYTVTKKGIAIMISVCIIFSGLFGFGGSLIANGLAGNGMIFGSTSGDMLGQGILNTGAGASETSYNLAALTGSELTIQEIITLAAHSVVEIRTETVTNDSWMQQYVTEGAGSGVIISSDGYIMTNNHVIENARKITVTLKNGKEYTATLIGTDSQTDIAVLKIDATGLTLAVYGDSDTLKVGDLAVAIGNPLGELGGTATAGIISALDRQLTINGKTMTLLQTDASINPGNSGGGLFNQYGQLVGLVVAKSSGSDVEGLGFAIPINQVKTIAAQLVDYGYVKGRIDTGMTFVDLTSMQNALHYGVRNLGIYVKSVDNQNAVNAGFQSGDMIYYVEDTKIASSSDLTAAFSGYSVGDKVSVTVVRDNQTKTLTLTLSEKTS